MRKSVYIGLICFIILGGALISFAATSSDSSSDNALLKKVRKAYKNINQFESATHVTITLKQGGWTTTRQGAINIAFDRDKNRLKIDQPGFYTVVTNDKLQMKSAQLPGQRLETSISAPITYNQLFKSLSQLMISPKLVNIALLTSDDPIEAISLKNNSKPTVITTKKGDKALQFKSEKGKVTLSIDSNTNLIKSMKVVADKQFEQRANVDSFSIECKYDIKSKNKKINKDAFKFDKDGLSPASSLRQMVQNIQKEHGSKNNSASNKQQQGAKAMEGKAAPHIALKTLDGKKFDSNSIKAKVLVLDFWATWCGPCVQHGLPELQKTYKWAKDNNIDVAIYAVNQGESTKTVKTFWDKTDYKMDVLMDQQSKVGRKFNVTAIPSTIIIANGKVQTVEVGVAPGSQNKLRKDIENALKAG